MGRSSEENKEVLAFVLSFKAKLIPRYASLKFHCALQQRGRKKWDQGDSCGSVTPTSASLASHQLGLFPVCVAYWVITSIFHSISSGH